MAKDRQRPPSSESRVVQDSPPKLGFRWIEREIRLLELAARQHWVVALWQVLLLGFTAAGVAHRTSVGRLSRRYRGVYSLGPADLTPKGRWMAAVLACGPDAFLSHLSAAALYGLLAPAGSLVDITIKRHSTLLRRGIRVHKHSELTAADVTHVDGIPVTSVARTLLGIAATGTPRQLERACEQAVILELFDMRAMSELLGRSKGRRGVRRLREVLARGDLEGGAPASGLERRYRDLCRDAGLPKPEINRWILLGDEYHKVDFLWRRERVVIEVDGDRFHSTGWSRARDARRDELLDTHGWGHARLSEDAIADDPRLAVETARALLRSKRTESRVDKDSAV